MEHLIRLAVDTGSIAEVYTRTTKTGRTGQAVEDVPFVSRLSRLQATLEYERTRVESGAVISDEDRTSDKIIEELVEIGRRSANQELIKKFQEMITEADRLYEKSKKQKAESLLDTQKKE